MTATIEAPPVTETLTEPNDGLQTPCPHVVELFDGGARFYCTVPMNDHIPDRHRCEIPASPGYARTGQMPVEAHITVVWHS